MATHELLHGRNLIIKADGEVLGLSKSCTIQVSAATIPVSSPNTGQWEESIPGRKKWIVQSSHLMYNRGATKPMDRMDMVGQTIQLSLDMLYENTVKFRGFIDDVQTIESGYVTVPRTWDVYYDTVHHCFVIKFVGDAYYKEWEYRDGGINPYNFNRIDDDVFYENKGESNNVKGEYYKATDIDQETGTYTLTRRDTVRQGNAIVTDWKGTFTRGNLATGNFEFLGTGPLAPLPTSEEDEDEQEE